MADNKKSNVKSAKYYVEKFNRLMLKGNPIIDKKTGETYVPLEDESFFQCYADTPERKIFPKYWFVSREGTLISVYCNGLRMIHKNKRVRENRYYYKFTVQEDGQGRKIKSINLHNLVGLVFGSYAYGTAKDKLGQNGVYAFGTTPNSINGHHEDRNATTNNPDELEFVTGEVHKLIHTAPKATDPDKRQFEYMKKFGDIARKEEPRQATVLLTDECYNSVEDYFKGNAKHDGKTRIYATKELNFTEQGMNDFLTMLRAIQTEATQKKEKQNESK